MEYSFDGQNFLGERTGEYIVTAECNESIKKELLTAKGKLSLVIENGETK